MNNIIKATGEYITTSFTGDNGTWELIGTTSQAGQTPMQDTDEFINRKTGERMEVKRSTVYRMAEEVKIK